MKARAFSALFALLIAFFALPAFAEGCKDLSDGCDQGQATDAVNKLVSDYQQQNESYNKGKKINPPSCGTYDEYCTVTGFACASSDCAGSVVGFTTYYLKSGACSARPALNSGWSSIGTGASCNSGCAYGPATSSDKTTAGGVTYFSLAGAKPTGASCSYGDGSGETVTKDECVTQGTLTQCMKPDGTHCAVSSSGKQFCWGATEAGTKSSGNEGATKSPVGTNINAPNSKPANGGDWQQSGQGTSSSTSGGNTTNYNITNWTSSYGSQGNGSGNGTGEGEGDGDGDGDSPGQGMGDFYQKSDKTVATVFADFKGKIADAPLFKSATSFLGGCSGGGQCPNETWDGGEYAGKFDLSQLCSGALGTLMNFAGYVFLAAMGAVGFRWALL
ncbi:hypothetical protein ACM9W9_10440 [Xanthomonas sacchari]